jgi:GTPase SAR1 family protein
MSSKARFTHLGYLLLPSLFFPCRTAEDAVVRLQIWDTAGEELYRAMTRSFFRDAAAGIIVYDITSAASFHSCKAWLKDFKVHILVFAR